MRTCKNHPDRQANQAGYCPECVRNKAIAARKRYLTSAKGKLARTLANSRYSSKNKPKSIEDRAKSVLINCSGDKLQLVPEVLRDRLIENLTFREIGDRYQITKQAAHERFNRELKKFCALTGII
jgi:predicted DNA-binding protein (UPF0251 family)